MTKDEALTMALDLIRETNASSQFWLVPDSNLNKAVTAIKAALAQEQDHFADDGKPMQEPVAYMYPADLKRFETSECFADAFSISVGSPDFGTTVPLFTAPPQRQPLTHEQRLDLLTAFEEHKHEWNAESILIDMVEAAHGIGDKT